jgi:hypothetical protein
VIEKKYITGLREAQRDLHVVRKVLKKADNEYVDLYQCIYDAQISINNTITYLGGNEGYEASRMTKVESWDSDTYDGINIRWLGVLLKHHGTKMYEDRVDEDWDVVKAIIDLLNKRKGRDFSESELRDIMELSDKADDARTEKHNKRHDKLMEQFAQPNKHGLFEKLFQWIFGKGEQREF